MDALPLCGKRAAGEQVTEEGEAPAEEESAVMVIDRWTRFWEKAWKWAQEAQQGK